MTRGNERKLQIRRDFRRWPRKIVRKEERMPTPEYCMEKRNPILNVVMMKVIPDYSFPYVMIPSQ